MPCFHRFHRGPVLSCRVLLSADLTGHGPCGAVYLLRIPVAGRLAVSYPILDFWRILDNVLLRTENSIRITNYKVFSVSAGF